MKIQVGDRVAVYEYTHRNPTPAQIKACVRDPWLLLPSPHYNQIQWWGDWVVTVLAIEGDWARVACEEFPPKLRQQGIRVPLSHVVLVESTNQQESVA